MELNLAWDTGLTSFREAWTDGAWGPQVELPTLDAVGEIVNGSEIYPVVVEPILGLTVLTFSAQAFDFTHGIQDTRGIVHRGIQLILQATSSAGGASADPNSYPTGWSYGQWSYYTWDSSRVPGPIVGARWLYNLKIVSLAGYPSGSWTAEIQRRDLLDRVNHTFQAYARLDQIIEAGDLTTDAGILVVDGEIYLTCTPKFATTNMLRCPVRSVLYHLDSVGEDGVGVFSLVASEDIPDQAPSSGQWVQSDYAAGQLQTSAWVPSYTYGWVNGQMQTLYGPYAVYGGSYTFPVRSTLTGTLAMTAYGHGLTNWRLEHVETFTNRIVTLMTYVGDQRAVDNPGDWYSVHARASYEITYRGLEGGAPWVTSHELVSTGDWDPSCFGVAHLVQSGVRINLYHTWGGGYYLEPYIAHPVTYNAQCIYALIWGSTTILDEWDQESSTGAVSRGYYLVDRDHRYRVRTPPSLATGSDEMVGLWGTAGEAVVFHREGQPLDYSAFYVLQSTDTAAAHPYSIFSYLDSSGEVVHLEGAEDPTPTLWRGETKIADLN
ncbi:hypothetical protein [Geothrix sp. 21YS21S-2]|uniref:hypothetical protein n=1 Tax=Geothrix sp. 21YS21S-2 TaxID=3068893 RepID=UPI0027B9CAEE|nr:hypothetical protein [Geothrix sp. 21YS21S-2]